MGGAGTCTCTHACSPHTSEIPAEHCLPASTLQHHSLQLERLRHVTLASVTVLEWQIIIVHGSHFCGRGAQYRDHYNSFTVVSGLLVPIAHCTPQSLHYWIVESHVNSNDICIHNMCMNVLCCITFSFPSPADKDLEVKTMTVVGGACPQTNHCRDT